MSHIWNEQLQEWIWETGQMYPEKCWLVSPLDTVHRNPFYDGPDQIHPEDESYEEE